MKTYEEMYGKPDSGWFYPSGGYQQILDAIGEIVVQVDEDGYQGDTWVLYRRGDEFGYLQFGWGSCSGCDALQACDSPKEVEELGRDLENSVMWKSREEMLRYFNDHDWAGDYGSEDRVPFIQRVKAILAGAA